MKKHKPPPEIIRHTGIVCPTCGRLHALYYVRSADDKRTLNYTCNKGQHQVWEGGRKILKTFTQSRPVEFVDGLEIEERWTKKYAKLVESRRHVGVTA